MVDFKGFWSYVHDDDKAEGDRITRLATDLKAQYEMIACEEIDLFVDRHELRWGQAWEEAINLQLASVAFFIPVITPRFFRSVACRGELTTFANHAEDLGVKDLVLPILYLIPEDFNDDDNEDVLVQLIKSLHYEDWTDLRFRAVDSGEYRSDVYRLAKFLFEANRRSEQEIPDEVDLTVGQFRSEDIDDHGDREDDTLGFLDQMANAEENLINLPITLDSMGQDFNSITEIMKNSTAEVKQSPGAGFSARLVIMKKTAKQMKEPVDNIWSKSNTYASQIHDVDLGYRILIKNAPEAIKNNTESKAQYCSLFKSIRYMSEKTQKMIEGAEGFIDVISTFESQSRDMRPVVRRLREGLTILIESSEVSKDWIDLIDGTGTDCED